MTLGFQITLMSSILFSRVTLIALIALFPVTGFAENAADEGLLAKGEYVFRISGCSHCHTTEDGKLLAGGRALVTPFGTFYTPNITPHRTAGIGAWTAREFRQSLHLGIAPDGSHYYPAFPYTSYTRITEQDMLALYTYIQSLPASDQASHPHDLAWFLRWRITARFWKWLFFRAGEFQQHPAQSAQWNRGAYIAEAMAHCGECHTPRNLLGALRSGIAYAGNAEGPEDELVPNITPDEESGIGNWSHGELESFLKFGELPDGEYAAGSMEPVTLGLQNLNPADLEALIVYLRALPPIKNHVRK